MGAQKDPPQPPTEPSPWLDMARELATNPDSPASMKIMSAVNTQMRPTTNAIAQLQIALADRIEKPGPAADAAVNAAVRHWEEVSGVSLGPGQMAELVSEAEKLVDARRRRPPPIETVVEGLAETMDAGYDLGVDLGGLRGTWHRLWAAMAMRHALGDGEESRACIAQVRLQLEQRIGRPLTELEYNQLEQHAEHHARAMNRGWA